MSEWKKPDLSKLTELQSQLKQMRAVVQAQKVKEIEKLEKVLDAFDLQTQDKIRKVVNGGQLD